MKKSFATLENKIEELEKEDSDISNSDDDEASHFQFKETGYQMVQFEKDLDGKLIQEVHRIPGVVSDKATVLHQAFETRIAQVLLKQYHKNKIEMYLRHVILLYFSLINI